MSSARFATRLPFVLNFASVASSGRLRIFVANRPNCIEDMSLSVEEGGDRQTDLLVVSSTDHDEAVFAGEDLVGDDGRMCRAVSAPFLSSNEVIRRDIGQPCKLPYDS